MIIDLYKCYYPALHRIVIILPRGPVTTTVEEVLSDEERPFLVGAGGRMEKLTSGGIESGARPICDEQASELEKYRMVEPQNPGRRNEGTNVKVLELMILSRPFDRVVESILCSWYEILRWV